MRQHYGADFMIATDVYLAFETIDELDGSTVIMHMSVADAAYLDGNRRVVDIIDFLIFEIEYFVYFSHSLSPEKIIYQMINDVKYYLNLANCHKK